MRYAIKEMFLTLQGEGYHAGRRAVFCRFAGCNLWTGREEDREKGQGACARWCDTDFFKGAKKSATEVVAEVLRLWGAFPRPFMVMTGGEPLLQLDRELIDALNDAQVEIAVETNGTIDTTLPLDWITLSPKLGGQVLLMRCDELKVVLPGHINPEMGWTDDALAALPAAVHRFVQPQDPGAYLGGGSLRRKEWKRNTDRCIEFVNRHPDWRLCIQQHKAVGLP